MSMDDNRVYERPKVKSYMDFTADFEIIVQLLICYSYTV